MLELYIDRTGLNELFVIRGEISTQDEWTGQSPLTRLYYDLLMNTDGKRHNVSQLKNGAKPSMTVSPKNEESSFSRETVEQMGENLRTFHQGSGNSGNVFLASKPIDLNFTGLNNKDMDYLNLLTNSQDSIYNLYNIPLALTSRNAMTYDNLTTANRMLYTEAVFPVYDKIAEGLLDNLRDRYNMSSQETLTYSQSDIEAMQPVIIENMKKLRETDSLSTNEIRQVGGLEDTAGGDEVLVNATKVPLSMLEMGNSFEDTEIIEDEL